jgi:hypothetical protein
MVDASVVQDLVTLDSQGFDLWKGNREMRAGDLIVMYRTAPFSDIAWVLVARSDGRKVKTKVKTTGKGKVKSKVRKGWKWPWQVEIAGGYRLTRTVKRQALCDDRVLAKRWDFTKSALGYTQRLTDLEAEGVWPALSRLIEAHSPGIAKHFGRRWTGAGRRRPVFLSYASPDKRRVEEIFDALTQEGIDVWLDQVDLQTAEDWGSRIDSAITSGRGFVVCISERWKRRRQRYARRELEVALEIAKRRRNFIFPILLEDCELPKELKPYHAARLFGRQKQSSLKRLVQDLGKIRQ